MTVLVGDRRVYINTKHTQTVKVCTVQSRQGQYEKYYRIYPPNVLEPGKLASAIFRFTNSADLERWLVNECRARREPEKEVRSIAATQSATCAESTMLAPSPGVEKSAGFSYEGEAEESVEVRSDVADVLDLLNANKYSPDEDVWLRDAKELVDRSIDRLLEEFIECPYLHRREHSIHAQLFWILMSVSELAKRVPLGDSLGVTQLVHKEWPESVGRDGNRRGNFDLVVLSPKLLEGCPSVKSFNEGRLHAPIVIEMGLDYDAEHLAGDAKKLIKANLRTVT